MKWEYNADIKLKVKSLVGEGTASILKDGDKKRIQLAIDKTLLDANDEIKKILEDSFDGQVEVSIESSRLELKEDRITI